jgi:hypothetical protein
MNIVIRPVLEPRSEIDITRRLTAAIAEELWLRFGGNALLNWLEAEHHLKRIAGRAPLPAPAEFINAVAPPPHRAGRVRKRRGPPARPRRTRRRLTLAGPRAAGIAAVALCAAAKGQTVLFDFDNAPIHTSMPIDLTAGGVTAHLSATGQGFSIQPADTMGFTPAGFAGLCVYPNSVFAADLLVGFSHPVTAFSILYAPQELGCDDSARMRVTASMNGVFVGTATTTVPPENCPCTWPSWTLSINLPQGFNSVVVHYDARPPTCQDWSPIFLADNMAVTPATVCYSNCDNSTALPILNVSDFACFLNRFAAGDSYANCDLSTAPPTLNVQDFACFLNSFAAGCP